MTATDLDRGLAHLEREVHRLWRRSVLAIGVGVASGFGMAAASCRQPSPAALTEVRIGNATLDANALTIEDENGRIRITAAGVEIGSPSAGEAHMGRDGMWVAGANASSFAGFVSSSLGPELSLQVYRAREGEQPAEVDRSASLRLHDGVDLVLKSPDRARVTVLGSREASLSANGRPVVLEPAP